MAALPARKKTRRHLDIVLRILDARGRKIDHRLGGQAADARLRAGARHLILEEIAIGHRGRAAEQHLGGGQLATPVDHLGIDLSGFGGKDMALEPGMQVKIVGHAPKQGHGRMAMAVDQTGNGQLSLSVQHCPCPGRWTIGHGADLEDVRGADGDKSAVNQRFAAGHGENHAVGYQKIDFHNCLHPNREMVYHREPAWPVRKKPLYPKYRSRQGSDSDGPLAAAMLF